MSSTIEQRLRRLEELEELEDSQQTAESPLYLSLTPEEWAAQAGRYEADEGAGDGVKAYIIGNVSPDDWPEAIERHR